MTVKRLVTLASTLLLVIPGLPKPVAAQEPATPSGTIAGRVVDEDGAAIAGVQIYIDRPAISTQTRNNGEYTLSRVPPGSHTLRARLLGYGPEAATVTVTAGRQEHQRVPAPRA